MAAPTLQVSPWATLADMPARAEDPRYALDLAGGGEVEDWIQVASDVLFNLTRRRYPGSASLTIRPVASTAAPLRSSGRVLRYRGGTTSVYGISEICLPNPPVTAITQVRVDGAVIAASRYTVFDHRWLVLTPQTGDTVQAWPSWQNLDVDAGQPDTFEVTYLAGVAPPEGGRRACATLALELAIADSPKVAGTMRTQERATTVARQGQTVTVADPADMIDKGLTGIRSVDLWIGSVNRGADRRTGSVHRLGSPHPRRAT